MEQFVLISEIILINIVLSGDNAVVIAMASKNLPPKQRRLAVGWGAFGAVALRILLTGAAVFLLKVPYIQAAGACLLVYIAIKLLVEDDGRNDVKAAPTLLAAVWTIVVADFVMSLDNVLAIAAITKGNYVVLALGIATSIPLIVWGSSLIMKLLQQFPILTYLGAGILGYTSGEMLIEDGKIRELLMDSHPSYHWIVPVFTTLIVIAAGVISKHSVFKTGK